MKFQGTYILLLEGPEREQRYSSIRYLTSALDGGWVANATPRPLYPRERDLVVSVEEARLAPWPVWTGSEYLTPAGIRSSDRPARSKSLYQLPYRGPSYYIVSKFGIQFIS
jgi:phosphatidate phosphatase APP1